MLEEGAPSDVDSSSSDSSSSHGEQEEAPRTADEVMLDQDRAMDDFMVDWFGANDEDGETGNNDEVAPIPNNPRPRHTPQGQQQWEEAKQQARTLLHLLLQCSLSTTTVLPSPWPCLSHQLRSAEL
ncbi:unnamed protein product [Calypogeia fissa]